MARMDIRQPLEDLATVVDDLAPESAPDDAADERTEEEFETQARGDGWVPAEELRSPSRRPPMTAREFVLRGETILPIVNARNRELRKQVERQAGQIEALTRTAAEQKDAIGAAMNLARTAGDRGYKRAIADLEAKRDAAVEIGDATIVRQTQDEIDAMKDERRAAEAPPAPAAPAPAPNAPPPGMHPEIHEFVSRPENAWFSTDQQLREALMAHHQLVRSKAPGLTMGEELRRARAALVADFPDRFPRAAAPAPPPPEDPDLAEYEDDPPPAPRRQAAPVMVPGNRPVREPRRDDPFGRITDLTERAEARSEFAKLQRGDPNASATEYVDIYLDPKADVLSIMQRRKK